MESSMQFMSAFDLFIACYVLYYAVKGDGKVYENEYPKEMKEAYRKLMRSFCWILGIGMLPLSVCQYIYGFTSPWSLAIMFYGAGCIAYFLITDYIKFKKPLKESGRNKNLPKKK